ncbi:MAG: T9SS type A sorting domain-containing protein [Sphingobacteriales bacterium]|nr:MAG: T9SS type A sorting domain-containing protein [Sphingobacteriales bacterium]
MKLDLYPYKGYYYAFLLNLLFVVSAAAQDCSSFTATFSTTESRCIATGTITVTAAGGSGNYNYRAVGPVTTTFTSSNVISGLPAGTYAVTVKDIGNDCEITEPAVVVPGSYSDPRFGLTSTDVTCTNGNDGTISVTGLTNGRNPFTYTIVAPSSSNIGLSNNTGSFTNLPHGTYSVQLRDSCGGMQTRIVGILNYTWTIAAAITKVGCDTVNVVVTATDNQGRTNTSGSYFNGFKYGVVRGAGDTVWSTNRTFRVSKETRRTLQVVAVDHCGTYNYFTWVDNARPSLGSSVTVSARACGTFTATVGTKTNLSKPQFCAINSSNLEVACNTTGVFPGLPYGNYTIRLYDSCYDTTITRSVSATRATPALAANVTVSNYGCSTVTAAVTGQSNLIAPEYRLLDSTGAQVATSANGVFNNVPYGRYTIRMIDLCDNIMLDRQFQAIKPIPVIGTVSTGGFGCTTFAVNVTPGANLNTPQYCLYDSTGALVGCNPTGYFPNLPYGNYCVRMSNLCSDTIIERCISASAPLPVAASAPAYSNETCSTFTAAINGTNLTNPTVCLYDANDILIRCEPTGQFHNLQYGSYTIKLTNSVGCYDTTIVRSFTRVRPVPVGGAVQTDNPTCAGFRAAVSGANYLTNPTYNVYNSSNVLVASNSDGIFNLSYGAYELRIVNSCYDTTIIRTFSAAATPSDVSVTSSASCNIGQTNLSVQFVTGLSPYTVEVYSPLGTLVRTISGAGPVIAVDGLPGLGVGLRYRVVGIDNCGGRDTSEILPVSSWFNKNIITNSKCPSGVWQNGSGDIVVTTSSNFGAVTPKIIRKNSAAANVIAVTSPGGIYSFINMEPATYVIEYSVGACMPKLYDTFTLHPYAFPELQQSAAYQCDNNSFSVGAAVTGGVGPFNYEVIGSYPASPSIIAPAQSLPVFNINNGTIYSLIRLRSVDACGNATLNDVSILPLANTIIRQTANCFYNAIVLNVDTIPNATYQWFKKNGPNDSIAVGSGHSYDIPYLMPSDTGMYVAKASVNGGCLTQVSYFSVHDYCGIILSSKVSLDGKKINGLNQLSWAVDNESDIFDYIVERSNSKDGDFRAVAKVSAKRQGKSLYFYTDNQAQDGAVYYRVRINRNSNKFTFTNTVAFKATAATGVSVFPNPVKEVMNVSVSNKEAQTLKLSVMTVTGQVIYEAVHQNVLNSTLKYRRPAAAKPGVYVLKISNLSTGEISSHKVMFE